MANHRIFLFGEQSEDWSQDGNIIAEDLEVNNFYNIVPKKVDKKIAFKVRPTFDIFWTNPQDQ